MLLLLEYKPFLVEETRARKGRASERRRKNDD
jgi:hypothetical protein